MGISLIHSPKVVSRRVFSCSFKTGAGIIKWCALHRTFANSFPSWLSGECWKAMNRSDWRFTGLRGDTWMFRWWCSKKSQEIYSSLVKKADSRCLDTLVTWKIVITPTAPAFWHRSNLQCYQPLGVILHLGIEIGAAEILTVWNGKREQQPKFKPSEVSDGDSVLCFFFSTVGFLIVVAFSLLSPLVTLKFRIKRLIAAYCM